MAKPITPEIIEEFRSFCEERIGDEQSGYFCLCHFDPFEDETEDGDPLWEFHASNHDPDDTYDIYELFHSLEEYAIEQHGYNEFYVVPKENEEA
jgi:hypothetical protein